MAVKGPPRRVTRDQARDDARDLDDISAMLTAGANVNGVIDGDGSALIGAARNGRLAAVRLLLDRGADPNLIVPGDGSPIIMAARAGHADVASVHGHSQPRGDFDRRDRVDRLPRRVRGRPTPVRLDRPIWQGDRHVYIALDGRVMAVPVRVDEAATAVEPGAPAPLFATRFGGAVQTNMRQQYVVSADGQRFLMNNVVEEAATPITILLNWRGGTKN